MKKKKFFEYFYIFFLGSILGWAIEGIYSYFVKGLLINHSALVVGPFNVVYGIAACLLTFLLVKHQNSPLWKIFIIGFIGGSVLEYVLSFGMELVLGFTAWDYSKKPFNLNGRICLRYSIYWGVLSIFWIKVAYPFISKLINKLNYKVFTKIMYVLIVFLLLDGLLTLSAVNRAKEFEKGIDPSNKYELFLDNHFGIDYLTNMFNNNWIK